MTEFTARNRSTAVVHADRERIWQALTDPTLLAQMTPYLRRVDIDGDVWRWSMVKLSVLGVRFDPSFSALMKLDKPREIDFTPAPGHEDDTSRVEGTYLLEEARGEESSTQLTIDLTITVDLPLPRAARGGVRRAMEVVIGYMGKKYGDNLTRWVSQ